MNPRSLFIILLIFLSGSGFAQKNIRIDSIVQIANDPNASLEDRFYSLDYLAWDVYLYVKPDSAVYYGAQMTELAKVHALPNTITNGLSVQAVAMKILGNYPRAIRLNEESLVIYNAMTRSDDSLTHLKGLGGKSAVRGNMGNIYRNMGDYDLALSCYKESMAYTEEIKKILGTKAGPRQKTALANGWINTGAVYIYQKKWSLAREANEKALAVYVELNDEDAQASCYRNLGMITESEGDFRTALSYYEKCLELRVNETDKTNQASVFNSLAVVWFKLGDYNRSIGWNTRSLQLARELNAPVAIRDACEGLYHVYRAKEQWDSAGLFLTEALSINDRILEINFPVLSEKEREKLFAMVLAEYASLYSFAQLHRKEQPELSAKAYSAIVRNKGMLLRSTRSLQRAVSESRDPKLNALYEQWLAKRNQIADLFSENENTFQAEEEANQLEKALIQSSPAFIVLDQMKETGWKQVSDQLQKNECAIEFISYRDKYRDAETDQYSALLIRPGFAQPEMIALCNADQLEKALHTSGSDAPLAAGKIYGTRSLSGTALYELIWKPLEAHLKGVETVYYSPDGLLHRVSFAAIRNSQGGFLSEQYKLICLSNTANLAQTKNFVYTKGKAQIYGGIDYGNDGKGGEVWNFLPGTKSESESIAALLSDQKYPLTFFTSAQATEEEFKASADECRILHLATHGFFFPDPERIYQDEKQTAEIQQDISFRGSASEGRTRFIINPNPLMRSGLVLANANRVWGDKEEEEKEDGVLTALEISTLDLHQLQLLVLSACETGLGDIRGSEGVYGLQRAFKMAGAQYMMISLWQVPDKETSEFMILFYRHLMKTKNIQEAFVKAQSLMRKKYDPYYWAAFVLVN